MLQIIGIVALAVVSYFAGKYGLLDVQLKKFIKWLYSKTQPKPVVVPEVVVEATSNEETTSKPLVVKVAAKK